MQPIRGECRAEPPITVEQHVADFGVNDVLTVGAVADKLIHLRGRPAERSVGEFLPRQQAEQQNSASGRCWRSSMRLARIPSAVSSGDRCAARSFVPISKITAFGGGPSRLPWSNLHKT